MQNSRSATDQPARGGDPASQCVTVPPPCCRAVTRAACSDGCLLLLPRCHCRNRRRSSAGWQPCRSGLWTRRAYRAGACAQSSTALTRLRGTAAAAYAGVRARDPLAHRKRGNNRSRGAEPTGGDALAVGPARRAHLGSQRKPHPSLFAASSDSSTPLTSHTCGNEKQRTREAA